MHITINQVNDVLAELKDGKNRIDNIRQSIGLSHVRTNYILKRLCKDNIVTSTKDGYKINIEFKNKKYVRR